MSVTHVELYSTNSCNIRGKQTWSSVSWFGRNGEGVILLNRHKSKLLNIGDGSVTKHNPLVERLITESAMLFSSRDGHLLVGVKKSGDIFAWEYCKNVVYVIHGLEEFKQKGDSLELLITGDVERIMVVRKSAIFYLWKRLKGEVKVKHPPKLTLLSGQWFTIDSPQWVTLPATEQEVAKDISCYENEIFSSVAFVDGAGVLKLSTLLVSTEPSIFAQRMRPQAEWFSQSLAGSSEIPVTSTPELLLVRYAPTVPICAVIINQLSVRDECILFVSPRHNYLVSSSLRCLRQSPTTGRSPLWIADVRWTYNSLLLLILTQSGCVAILSRMGSPLYLSTREMSISGTFDHLLSLLPRNIISGQRVRGFNRSLSMSSAMERQVSLSCCSFAMKFILSDGKKVLIFQIPEDITTRSLAMALLSDARMVHEKRLRSAVEEVAAISSNDMKSSADVDHQLNASAMRSLTQVWCLLLSADYWSKELKDVSNEVVNTVAQLIRHQITSEDVKGSAVRLVHTTITLITMVTVDSARQHLLPSAVKLISLIVRLLLEERQDNMDLQIRLAEVAFVLVKVCENILNRTYSMLPTQSMNVMGDDSNPCWTHEVAADSFYSVERIVPAGSVASAEPSADGHQETMTSLPVTIHSSLSVNSSSLVSKCLTPLYQKLQTHLSELYNDCTEDSDLDSLHRVLEAVQHSMLAPRLSLLSRDTTWLPSDILSLEGFHSAAVSEWLDKYTDAESSRSRSCDILHAIVYTKLCHTELADVLQFVEGLIMDDLARRSHSSDKEYLNIKSLHTSSAVRRVVQSLARFMARYFTNGALYVFPPHNPHSLPPLYSGTSNYISMVSISRQHISDSATRLPSADSWSITATVRYLLIAGLISELIWFSKAVGDAKTSLSVSLLLTDHHKTLKHIKRYKVNTLLPQSLAPEAIHREMFQNIIKDATDMTPGVQSTIHNLMLPTSLFGLQCLTSQLSSLWQQIKMAATELSALVPNELYLPHPELYCPQVPLDVQGASEELLSEITARERLSHSIQTFIGILVSTHTDLPCCGWLVRSLLEVWKLQDNKKKELVLDKYLELYLPYHVTESDKHNKLMFAMFRNVCSVLWLIHVRDQLSAMLRKSTELLQSQVSVTVQADEQRILKTRNKHLEKTMTWCLRYLPFAHFLQCTNTVCEVVISICEDLPPTAKLARKLSQGITDIDSLAPEIKDKMDHLLQTWHTVELDPHKSKSLSMYYFECCNNFENRPDQQNIERNIFSTQHGHKVVGTRSFEFDSAFVQFLGLFFSVSFQSSLPDVGTAKPPALVATNKKTLEQIHLSKLSLAFDGRSEHLEMSLQQHKTVSTAAELNTSDGANLSREDNPGKSGMFRSKRWSVSEEETMKQMKKLGVSVRGLHPDSTLSDTQKDRMGKNWVTLDSSPPSLLLLMQDIRLTERYQKLGVKFQWLKSWCDKQTTMTSSQPATKVDIDVQWLVIALMMVEKSRQGPGRAVDRLPPSRVEEKAEAKIAKSPPKVDPSVYNINNSALANAISIHTSTDMEEELEAEEDLNRKEILEEMRRHSGLATATQPINLAHTISPPLEPVVDGMDDDRDGATSAAATSLGMASANSYILDETATTVWSSATLPNMSGSSHLTGGTAGIQPDTTEQVTGGKSLQTVSTVSSRKSRYDRLGGAIPPPAAESTQYADGINAASTPISPPRGHFRSQIPLLQLSKEPPNSPYYSDSHVKLGARSQHRAPDLLQVHSVHNSASTAQQRQQPECVKLPLLSVNAPAAAPSATGSERVVCDEYELAKIRQEDTRWSRPGLPQLRIQENDLPKFPVPPPSQVASGDQLPTTFPNTANAAQSNKSITMAMGPALLKQYEEANRQKEELLTRMIRAMRSKSKPVAEHGKPIHPKYSLLKLEPAAEEPTVKVERPKQVLEGGYRAKNEPKSSRHRHRRKRSPPKKMISADTQLAELDTVSERTEHSPKTVEASTEPAVTVETVDKSIQHSPAHLDDTFNEYSYLFNLANTRDDGGGELVNPADLEAAADENTFAAVQYKAMKLQTETERKKPVMVDAGIMAVEPESALKTIVVQGDDSHQVPSVAPNLLHDLKFITPVSEESIDKENLPSRQYLGVVDIPAADIYAEQNDMLKTPPQAMEEVSSQPRSQQILQEIQSNITDDKESILESHRYKHEPRQNGRSTLNIPYYEYEEFTPPKVIIPKHFEAAEVKDEGKLNIARNLSNMDDRLEYIEELRNEMMDQIQSTDMILPRYHLSYQQRQTQTRLSIPSGEGYTTILEPRHHMQDTQTETHSPQGITSMAHQPATPVSGVNRQQVELESSLTDMERTPLSGRHVSVSRVDQTVTGKQISSSRTTVRSTSRSTPRQTARPFSVMSTASNASMDVSHTHHNEVFGDTADVVNAAEQIMLEDSSLAGDVTSEMVADLLASDNSLLSPTLDTHKKKTSLRRKEELKNWQKSHQAKVRERYKQELEQRCKPEARPFNSDRNVTVKEIRRVKEERERRRDELRAQNQTRRIQTATNLLKDMETDNDANLLNFGRMTDFTMPVAVSKKSKQKKPPLSNKKKSATVQRGKLYIQPSAAPFSGYIPSGFHTTDMQDQYPGQRDSAVPNYYSVPGENLPMQYRYHTANDDSYDVDELPLDDESFLLVPRFRDDETDAERIRQLLYSDDDMGRADTEINLSSISDLISESEVSAGSLVDWGVIDEMVAILSNRELSTPSTIT